MQFYHKKFAQKTSENISISKGIPIAGSRGGKSGNANWHTTRMRTWFWI